MSNGTPIIIKKKKGHGHGHHGGAWKVAYADFVTAMMAFFMVMWIMGMSDEARAQIQGYFNDPFGYLKNNPKTKQMVPLKGSPTTKPGLSNARGQSQLQNEKTQAQKIKNDLEEAIERVAASGGGGGTTTGAAGDLKLMLEGVEISLEREGLEINLVEKNGEAFFESGSAVLRPGARAILGRIAPILAQSGRSMMIDGHTDAKPFPGKAYDNWDLSTDRAAAVRRALKAGGVRESQVLMVRGNADRKLRYPDQPYHFSNRRVSVLLPFKMGGDTKIVGPAETVKEGTQATFRKPVNIGPTPIDLESKRKKSFWSGEQDRP